MVFFLALIVYLRTLCRTVYVGDSGELIAAVHTLGIPHPPGYPLYVLLGKAFSVALIAGSPALRLNVFSAVCAAGAAATMCLTMHLAGFSTGVAAASALTAAFSASLWSQATIARVYAPAALALGLVFYFFTHWQLDPDQTQWLAAAIGVAGAGIAVHPVVGGAVLGMLVAILCRQPNAFLEPRTLALGLWILPGLALFLWIPLRAHFTPTVRWANLRTLPDLCHYFTRRDYWKFRYVRSPRRALEVMAFYANRVTWEYGLMGAAMIIVGLPLLSQKSPALLALALTTALATLLSMLLHARRQDIFFWPRYMIPAWLALALPLAAGLSWAVDLLPPFAQPFAPFILPVILLVSNFRQRDLSHHRFAEHYSGHILANLPPNATLIADDDSVLFPLMYLKYALKLRPDVTLIDQAARDRGRFAFNPQRDAVYTTHWQAAFVRPASAAAPGLTLIPEGLVYRIVSTSKPYAPQNLWPGALPPDIDNPGIPKDFLTRRLLANVCLMRAQWDALYTPAACAPWCARASTLAPDCDAVQHNVAVVLGRNGLTEQAKIHLKGAADIERNVIRWPTEAG